MTKRIIALFLAAVVFFTIAWGRQNTASADTTVWFVNAYPGSDIYQLEGHSAIAVFYPDGREVAFNFGVFDFNAPNFVFRFVKGETDYMAAPQPLVPFLNLYKAEGRRLVAHELELSAEQTKRLVTALETNILPQNRTYRYNYVYDNCATRPLRAVETALGDSIFLPPAPMEANSYIPLTFRNIMRHYHRNYPWYQFGIDLALGSGIDFTIDRRQATFAPAELDRMLPLAKAGDKPVVSKTIVLNDVAPDAAIDSPTPFLASPMGVFWIFFLVVIGLTIYDLHRRRTSKWFDALFFGILGLTGCLLTFLIFVSVHEATSPNWLYVWINPLCFIPTVFIWLKKGKNVVLCYQFINFVALFVLLVCWYWLPQSANPAFLPIILAEMLRSAAYLKINHK